MDKPLEDVVVTGIGSYLPGEPVTRDAIESLLGPTPDAPPAVQRFMGSVGRRLLAGSEVETRHFALDPATGRATHSVATLAAEAARHALSDAGREPDDVDLLILSGPAYDCGTPPTSALLQECLGIRSCTEMEIHSNCSGIGKGIQIAHDSLRLGRHRCALFVYAQLSSVMLHADYFNQPKMTREQALLRYILADGAGAIVMEPRSTGRSGHLLLGAHAESQGLGHEPGMTSGGGVADFFDHHANYAGIHEMGSHHLDQDFGAVRDKACTVMLEGTCNMLRGLGIDTTSVAQYVWSIPTMQLYRQNIEQLVTTLGVPEERQVFRARDLGYSGGASVLVYLDAFAKAGGAAPGETVVCYAVESSKWMSGGFALRWSE